MIVPHPALQSFRAVQVLYTAYSGWISSGLAKWSIDRISLMDAFGKSLSVCKNGILLETGVPVVLPLYPGVCNQPSNNTSNTSFPNQSTSGVNITKPKYIPTQVVQIGDEILNKNSTSTLDEHYLKAQWQPVLEYPVSSGNSGNALDQGSGRAFYAKSKREHNDTTARNDTLVLGELVMVAPVVNMTETTTTDPDLTLKMSLMGEFLKNDNKYIDPPYEFVKPQLQDAEGVGTKGEIKEPILPATTPRQQRSSKEGKWQPEPELNPPSVTATEDWPDWELLQSNRRVKNMDLDKNTNSTLSALTIQFLPQRLISFLEQAEKYARLAFSPFLSNDPDAKGQRRLRFLPSFWWGKSEDRSEKKLDFDNKDKDPKKELIDGIPFSNKKTDLKPNYIPLTSETDSKLIEAEPDFKRPPMIKAHMEEPMIEDLKEKKEEI